MLQWIFDRGPDSDAWQLGVTTSHLFKGGTDTFVREIIQNSYGQRQNRDDTVHVRFTLVDLEGDSLARFLEQANWQELEPRMEYVSQAGYHNFSGRIQRGLESIRNDHLRVLLVEDFHTKGLHGSDEDKNKSFRALCKNTLHTDTDNAAGSSRGGSYGLGKSVLWSFSSLSTVFFLSRSTERPDALRVFGKSELAFHEAAGDDWSGLGFFGSEFRDERRRKAVSVYGEEADEFANVIHASLRNGTPVENQLGTTVIVPGFVDPDDESESNPEELCKSFVQSAADWFWPSFSGDVRRLEVSARYLDAAGVEQFDTAMTDDLIPGYFKRLAKPEVSQEFLDHPGSHSSRQISVQIPQLKPDQNAGNSTETKVRVSVTRLNDDESGGISRNKYAVVRGAGMVVEYRDIKSGGYDYPIAGMLEAGNAAGSGDSYEFADEFFRACEPHAHNQWISSTNRVKDMYKPGAGRRLPELWRAVDNAIDEAVGAGEFDTTEGPERLARYFPFGQRRGGGPGTPRVFDVTDLDARLDGLNWKVSGKVRLRKDVFEEWHAVVAVYSRTESGLGKRMPLTITSARADVDDSNPQEAVLHPHVGTFTVSFNGETGVQPDISVVSNRSQLSISVLPKLGAGQS